MVTMLIAQMEPAYSPRLIVAWLISSHSTGPASQVRNPEPEKPVTYGTGRCHKSTAPRMTNGGTLVKPRADALTLGAG